MDDETPQPPAEIEISGQLDTLQQTRRQRVVSKLVAAALGAVPWVGGFLAAMIALREEEGQSKMNSLHRQWLEEHKVRMEALATEIASLTSRMDGLGTDVSERIESEEYLAILRRGFRQWDQADTEQKRGYISKLLANAAAITLVDDDLIRLFLDWLDRYHETHFKVIREIYQHPGSTRYEIWKNIRGKFPREDSSEADLFRLLISDLSIGRIIRQHRATNYQGQFIKKTKTHNPSGVSSTTMKSAFDDEEQYELTELGSGFVHYVFTEIVPRIEQESAS